MPQITKIPASIQPKRRTAEGEPINKTKVAAYARVSTDKDEQMSSYAAQLDYYDKYIKSRSDWEFVKVYSDEGITGTSIKKRQGFNSMIEDALAGKIDLIITKSVSRFARNTVDSISTIRKLKEHKVQVFFEKENIWTFDSKGELLLTIMSSLAQEESRSISENSTWGKRKAFADGKVSVAYSRFLGYDKGPDGNLVINPEQAKVVKKIFDLYQKGFLPTQIARLLTDEGIPTVTGRPVWKPTQIFRILTNEKYKGDALLQKYYNQDFLTKKQIRNTGEIAQYYVEGNHEPIIDPIVFDHVQLLIKRNHENGCVNASCFANTVYCGECGAVLIPRVWHSKDPYRKKVWLCYNRYGGTRECKSKWIDDTRLQEILVEELNKLISKKREVILESKRRSNIKDRLDEMDAQLEQLNTDLNTRANQLDKLLNYSGKRTPEESEAYLKFCNEYEAVQLEYNRIKTERTEISMERYAGRNFRNFLGKTKRIREFKEEHWRTYVKRCDVFDNGRVILTFVDGTTVETLR